MLINVFDFLNILSFFIDWNNFRHNTQCLMCAISNSCVYSFGKDMRVSLRQMDILLLKPQWRVAWPVWKMVSVTVLCKMVFNLSIMGILVSMDGEPWYCIEIQPSLASLSQFEPQIWLICQAALEESEAVLKWPQLALAKRIPHLGNGENGKGQQHGWNKIRNKDSSVSGWGGGWGCCENSYR